MSDEKKGKPFFSKNKDKTNNPCYWMPLLVTIKRVFCVIIISNKNSVFFHLLHSPDYINTQNAVRRVNKQ